MMIEGNDVPISEDYRTHWFDSGRVRPAPSEQYNPNKLLMVQYAGAETNYAVHRHTNAENVSYTIYVNYNNTKIKCGTQILDMALNDIKHTLRNASVALASHKVGIECADGTIIKPGQMQLLYSKNWDSFKDSWNPPTEILIRVITPLNGFDPMNLPFIYTS